MPRFRFRLHAFAASPLGLWLLVLAMAVQGVSGAITGVVGAQHRHTGCAAEEASPSTGVWQPLLSQWLGEGVMAILVARQGLAHAASPRPAAPAFPVVWTGPLPDELVVSEAADRAPPPAAAAWPAQASCHSHGGPSHAHADFKRHVHAPHDASTQTIGQADGGDDAAWPHADLPWGLAPLSPAAALAALPRDPRRWGLTQQARPRGWLPAPLERPPRA